MPVPVRVNGSEVAVPVAASLPAAKPHRWYVPCWLKQQPQPQPGLSLTAPVKAVPVVVQPLRLPLSKSGFDRAVPLAPAGDAIRGEARPRHIAKARSSLTRMGEGLVVALTGERVRMRTSCCGWCGTGEDGRRARRPRSRKGVPSGPAPTRLHAPPRAGSRRDGAGRGQRRERRRHGPAVRPSPAPVGRHARPQGFGRQRGRGTAAVRCARHVPAGPAKGRPVHGTSTALLRWGRTLREQPASAAGVRTGRIRRSRPRWRPPRGLLRRFARRSPSERWEAREGPVACGGGYGSERERDESADGGGHDTEGRSSPHG